MADDKKINWCDCYAAECICNYKGCKRTKTVNTDSNLHSLNNNKKKKKK